MYAAEYGTNEGSVRPRASFSHLAPGEQCGARRFFILSVQQYIISR